MIGGGLICVSFGNKRISLLIVCWSCFTNALRIAACAVVNESDTMIACLLDQKESANSPPTGIVFESQRASSLNHLGGVHPAART